VFRPPDQLTFLVYKIIGRPAGDCVIFSDMARVNTCWEGIIMLGDKISGLFVSKGRMDAYDHKTFILKFVIYPLRMWQFFTAWPTLHTPKIQKDDFTSQLRQQNCLSELVFYAKIRRYLSYLQGTDIRGGSGTSFGN